MKILAVDTATNIAAVALSDGTRLIGEEIVNDKLTHSAKLMTMVDRVLKAGGIAPAEIDVYAVVTGPGSFTGLRIGIAAVKGLASVFNKPVAAVTALLSLAGNFPYCSQIVCPMLDARNRLVYASAYRTEAGEPEELFDISCDPLEAYLDRLAGLPGNFLFCGNAANLYEADIKAALGNRAAFAPVGILEQRASSLCVFAQHAAERGELLPYGAVVPTYFKASQPEREGKA